MTLKHEPKAIARPIAPLVPRVAPSPVPPPIEFASRIRALSREATRVQELWQAQQRERARARYDLD